MKLTLNRREEQKKGMFSSSTVYCLDVYLEATPEEIATIKKYQWDNMPFCESTFLAGRPIEFTVGDVVGQPKQWGFKTIEELAHAESQVIENAKNLKQQLEAVAGFTSGGPREIEL